MFNGRQLVRSISAEVLVLILGSTNANAAGEVSLEYVAHASFRITSPSGERILIDPFGSREWIGYDYPAGIEADAVLISHPHYDHDGGISRGHDAPWSATTTVWREPGHYVLGDIDVLGVAGKHADPYGKEFGQTNTIWLLEVAGLRIAHIGDNGPISDLAAARLGTVDIVMMPIDADYHILKEHEIRAVLGQLRPSIVIPMHYRLGDLEPDDEKPSGLGDIDGWLASRNNVRRLGSHQVAISVKELPASQEILVFEHSPLVQRPN